MSNSNNNDTILKKVGGLWMQKSQSGNAYLSGSFKLDENVLAGQDIRIMIFKQKEKRNEKSPDYSINVRVKKSDNNNNSNTQQPAEEDGIIF